MSNIPEAKIITGQDCSKRYNKTYYEAVKIKNLTPTLFAIQIGKALEFLCKDQKAQGKSLVQQIQDLSIKGIIPPTLLKMTEIMRVLRNIAAHASSIDITSSEADSIDGFFNIIVEYVYIAPYKINCLMQRLNTKRTK